MFFFDGCTCPVCGQSLKKDDDIVVCPKCGAPHHRECYKADNRCAFDDRHEESFVWTKEEFCTQSSEDTEKNSVRCEYCGADNPADRLYCSVCSHQLFSDFDASSDAENHTRADAPSDSANPAAGPFYVAGSSITISDSELIDDVPVGDLKRFVQNTFFYYIPTFYVMARSCKKITLNIIALFTHGLWFISRKMYLLGSFLLTAQLAIQFALNYFQRDYVRYLEPAFAEYESTNDSMVLMQAMMDYLTNNQFGAMAILGLTAASFAIYAFSGLFANHIYMRTCIKRVKEINSSSSSVDDFNSKLLSQGGISVIATLLFAIIYFIAMSYINQIFIP